MQAVYFPDRAPALAEVLIGETSVTSESNFDSFFAPSPEESLYVRLLYENLTQTESREFEQICECAGLPILAIISPMLINPLALGLLAIKQRSPRPVKWTIQEASITSEGGNVYAVAVKLKAFLTRG